VPPVWIIFTVGFT